MSSLFDKNPNDSKPVDRFSRSLIESEIGHLGKGKGTRHLAKGESKARAQAFFWLLVMVLVVIFCIDPFYFSYYKNDAVRSYLYLRAQGDTEKAATVANSGMLGDDEVQILNHKTGSFSDLFPSEQEGRAVADRIVNYQKEIDDLQAGHVDQLNGFEKMRYYLFFHFGISTPRSWDFLNPKVTMDSAAPSAVTGSTPFTSLPKLPSFSK